MADDPTKRGEQDRVRVSFRQRHERQYWTKRFRCSDAELEAAVHAVGPMVKDVRLYIEARKIIE